MLLILVFVYLFHGAIRAAPIANHLRDTMPPDLSSSNQCLCPDQQRSLWDILWSCLATIFACTWVSVHPNIPPAGEGWWKTSFRRLELMIWGVIAPELIVYWAMAQWRAARDLKMKYHGQGWTKTHGYFIQMGGFTLFRGKEPQGVLLPKRLQTLFAKGEIDFPAITEEEIRDRSKGDGLSKGLVVGQTSWFIAQCIARRAQGLAITELELVTAAFAVLNGVTYFLLWNKPLDVRCSVPVYILDNPKTPLVLRLPERPAYTLQGVIFSFFRMIYGALIDVLAFMMSSVFTLLRRIWRTIKDVNLLRNAVMIILTSPWIAIRGIAYRVIDILGFGRAGTDQMVSVHTFYAYDVLGSDAVDRLTPSVALSIASIFGGLHCVGWFFTFPSRAESIIWRVCSLAVSFIPLTILFLLAEDAWKKSTKSKTIQNLLEALEDVLGSLVALSIPMYGIARLLLLGEAFAALRFLPPAAVAVVDWIEFLPHI